MAFGTWPPGSRLIGWCRIDSSGVIQEQSSTNPIDSVINNGTGDWTFNLRVLNLSGASDMIFMASAVLYGGVGQVQIVNTNVNTARIATFNSAGTAAALGVTVFLYSR